MSNIETISKLFQKAGSDVDSEAGKELHILYPKRPLLIYKLAMNISLSNIMKASLLITSKPEY